MTKTEPISIIALASCTNIAAAILLDPTLPKRVEKLVIMGGNINHTGNRTPVAEANFHSDPLAASLTLRAGFDTLLVPLNLTHKVPATRTELLHLFGEIGPQLGPAFTQMFDHYLDFYQSVGHDGYCYLHDPSAIVALTDPHLFPPGRQAFVDVETTGRMTRGVCVADHSVGGTYHINQYPLIYLDHCEKQPIVDCIFGYIKHLAAKLPQ